MIGSTDNSKKICEKYQKKDSRIKIINKSNGGLSDARNVGIENANGKYITFIDSDDFIEIDYLEYLYYLIKKYNTRISICSYSVFMENGKCIDYGKKYNEKMMDSEETFKRMLNEEGFSVSAWAKLYETKMFKNVKYPKGRLCEDNGTTYKIFAQTDTFAYGNESKYFYLKRQGSIMLSAFNVKKMDMIYLTDEMCDFIDRNNITPKIYTDRRRIYSRFNILRQINNSDNKDIEKEMIEYILSRKRKILFSKVFPKRDKIALLCLMINKQFFRFMWKIYCKLTY